MNFKKIALSLLCLIYLPMLAMEQAKIKKTGVGDILWGATIAPYAAILYEKLNFWSFFGKKHNQNESVHTEKNNSKMQALENKSEKIEKIVEKKSLDTLPVMSEVSTNGVKIKQLQVPRQITGGGCGYATLIYASGFLSNNANLFSIGLSKKLYGEVGEYRRIISRNRIKIAVKSYSIQNILDACIKKDSDIKENNNFADSAIIAKAYRETLEKLVTKKVDDAYAHASIADITITDKEIKTALQSLEVGTRKVFKAGLKPDVDPTAYLIDGSTMQKYINFSLTEFKTFKITADDNIKALQFYNDKAKKRNWPTIDIFGDWLDDGEIRTLLNYEESLKRFLPKKGAKILIVDNAALLTNNAFGFGNRIKQIKKRIEAGKPERIAIIIGTMQRHKNQDTGDRGHWYPICIEANVAPENINGEEKNAENIQVSIFDSLNNNRIYSAEVKKLLKALGLPVPKRGDVKVDDKLKEEIEDILKKLAESRREEKEELLLASFDLQDKYLKAGGDWQKDYGKQFGNC